MQVPLSRVLIIGLRGKLDPALEDLYHQRRLHLADAGARSGLAPYTPDSDHEARRTGLRLLAAQLEGLLRLAPASGRSRPAIASGEHPLDEAALRAELDALQPRVDELVARREALEVERLTLERYLEPLRILLPLIPELAELSERKLAELGLETIALVLASDDDSVIRALDDELRRLLGERFELQSVRVDEGAVGCLLVVPRSESGAVHELLGRERVRSVPLPDTYARMSLTGALSAMQRRLEAVPADQAAVEQQLVELLTPHLARWRAQLAVLSAELAQLDAAELTASTSRAFVIEGWAPSADVEDLRGRLEQAVGGEAAVQEVASDTQDIHDRPVLLRHSRPVGPFATLVRLFDLPRSGALDPSGLMALFLPFLFGAMVGDVGYGLGLLTAAWFINRRFAPRSAIAADLARVLAWCAGWSVLFGVLFGEFLGSTGKDLFGMPALWFYRGGENALEPLLLFALAIGVTHIALGLLLGVWQSWRDRHRGDVVERLGTLAFVIGLVALAAAATDQLPSGALGVAAAAMVLGGAAAMSAHGALGMITGPLGLIGAVGNVLSYLRVAAVGLASVYLAVVANEFATQAPLLIGVVVAAFFHALNLALAAFSPFIQSLRLHYVEFFSKFHAGGGRPFRPFGEASPAGDLAASSNHLTERSI